MEAVVPQYLFQICGFSSLLVIWKPWSRLPKSEHNKYMLLISLVIVEDSLTRHLILPLFLLPFQLKCDHSAHVQKGQLGHLSLVKNTSFKKDICYHIWVRAYFWTEELSCFCWVIWIYPLCELMVINLIPEDKVIISAILNWLLSYFMHSTHILWSGSTEGLSKYIGHMYSTVVY